jgi:hypothetical protein
VTITSTPVNPVSAITRNVFANGLAKNAAEENRSRGGLTPLS